MARTRQHSLLEGPITRGQLAQLAFDEPVILYGFDRQAIEGTVHGAVRQCGRDWLCVDVDGGQAAGLPPVCVELGAIRLIERLGAVPRTPT